MYDYLLCDCDGALTVGGDTRERSLIRTTLHSLARVPLPAAAVSNRSRAQLAAAVERAGLTATFGKRLFGAEDAARAKPHPDLYLEAARRLGVPPTSCVAVADNLAGLYAARDAGMATIAFVGASASPERYARVLRSFGVARIIETMDELPALVARARSVAPQQTCSGTRWRSAAP
jgi:beta-phosphoglucomutase-like phosphatase (HAD superfamily)